MADDRTTERAMAHSTLRSSATRNLDSVNSRHDPPSLRILWAGIRRNVPAKHLTDDKKQ